jgi:hypothetical protein
MLEEEVGPIRIAFIILMLSHSFTAIMAVWPRFDRTSWYYRKGSTGLTLAGDILYRIQLDHPLEYFSGVRRTF